MIYEISETGESIRENKLKILDILFESGLFVYISRKQIENQKILSTALEIYIKLQKVLNSEKEGKNIRSIIDNLNYKFKYK